MRSPYQMSTPLVSSSCFDAIAATEPSKRSDTKKKTSDRSATANVEKVPLFGALGKIVPNRPFEAIGPRPGGSQSVPRCLPSTIPVWRYVVVCEYVPFSPGESLN